jgi:peptide/nickel transport system substrate-binding protein
MLFQTSINAPRQKTQAVVKQAAAKVGIEMELKSIVPAVYFSTDPANPAPRRRTFSADNPDVRLHHRARTRNVSWTRTCRGRSLRRRTSGPVATRPAGATTNSIDFSERRETEMDPVKRRPTVIRMNDLLTQNVVIVPFIWRGDGSAVFEPAARHRSQRLDSNC